MSITIIEVISITISIIMLVWALLERSKRLPLWHIINGIERNTMSNMILYMELKNKYSTEKRELIPINEFLLQIDNDIANWRSQRDIIIGIKNSITKKKEETIIDKTSNNS